MAQLDVSIIYDQFCVTIICFYVFICYISYILVKFWYNKRCREEVYFYELDGVLNQDFHIKKILSL